MSDHNQKVEPVRFEPAGIAATDSNDTSPQPRTKGSAAGHNTWVIPALGGLAVLAVLVFFWLPSQVSTDPVELDTPPVTAKSKPRIEEATPWSDAQLARQRKDAQDILALLLDQQFALEEMRVELWAEETFADALGLAATGDEQYRQQEFLTAAASYQQALDAMLAIKASADTVFEELLQRGLESLRSDQAQAALEALDVAVVIRPDNPEALAALERARNLGPLLELLEEANQLRDSGDLLAALEVLKRAAALDPQHAGALAQLKGLERDIARRDFNMAMTEGYQALDDGNYDEAERQFKQAQRIMPAAAEPQGALEQTRISRTQAQIEAWRQRATAAKDREDWNRAVSAYQEILAIDQSVVFARAGLIQSKARAQLDRRLKEAVANPQRLANEQVYQDTQAMFKQAMALEKKGPILRQQLFELDEILRLAIIPVPVLLQSDEQTDVTVYRVARLGSFRRHQLELKPGDYTAVGVRKGYRDVRVDFTVDPAQPGQLVEVSCTEPI